jgi:hypothetical protein
MRSVDPFTCSTAVSIFSKSIVVPFSTGNCINSEVMVEAPVGRLALGHLFSDVFILALVGLSWPADERTAHNDNAWLGPWSTPA